MQNAGGLHREVRQACHKAGATPPSYKTIQSRVRDFDPREVITRRTGPKQATQWLSPVKAGLHVNEPLQLLPKNKFLAAQHIDFDWPLPRLAERSSSRQRARVPLQRFKARLSGTWDRAHFSASCHEGKGACKARSDRHAIPSIPDRRPPVGISGIALSRSPSGREAIRPFSLFFSKVERPDCRCSPAVRFRTLAYASGHDHCVARLPIPVSSFAANVLRLESVVWGLLCCCLCLIGEVC